MHPCSTNVPNILSTLPFAWWIDTCPRILGCRRLKRCLALNDETHSRRSESKKTKKQKQTGKTAKPQKRKVSASAKVFQSNGNNLPTLLQWNELLGRRVILEMLFVLPFFAISLSLVLYEFLRSVGEKKTIGQTTTKQPNNRTTATKPGTKHAYWVSIFVFLQCQMMWVPVQFLFQSRPPTASHQSSHSIFDTPKH